MLGDSAELTDQHKAIAEYWADGQGTETLPGHWCLLAQWVSARDRHGLDQDVVLFFALGGALHDAAVAAWDAKRAFDSVRPVSAIRLLFAGEKVCAWGGLGQGTTLIKGEQWKPYIPTPPFAEYVSGHSTFSAAAAEVLARSTGSDRFGGIHIRDGDLVGRVLGRLVGLRAWLAASALVGMRARARSGVAA